MRAPASWPARLASVTGLQGARLDPGRDGVRALGVVAIGAVLLSGALGCRARPVVVAPARSPTAPAAPLASPLR